LLRLRQLADPRNDKIVRFCLNFRKNCGTIRLAQTKVCYYKFNIMYSPKYTITNVILKNIGVVEACREVVNNAPIIPSYEKKFRVEAETAVIHHGTHIEGNELSYTQAEEVLAGKEVTAADRDIQEVINYRSVLEYIDGEVQENISGYTEKQILKIHSGNE
jgi:hypothetical protein